MERIVVAVLFAVVSGQFLPIHVGDIETTIDGYRFQFHDEFHFLLVVHGLDCYVSDVPAGSSLEKKLMDETSIKSTYAKIIPVIEAGNAITRTDLDKVNSKYADSLLRALCYRTEIFNLDLSSIS